MHFKGRGFHETRSETDGGICHNGYDGQYSCNIVYGVGASSHQSTNPTGTDTLYPILAVDTRFSHVKIRLSG